MVKAPKVVVLGSINMDLVARCSRLPRAGETLTASDFCEVFGGKGANQAIGAARAGGQVQMISRVGDDVFADKLIQNLLANGIDCQSVSRTQNCPSGLAFIAVDDSGENQIVVVPGANGRVSTTDVDRFAEVISQSDCLLVQLETPLESVVHAIKIARQSSVPVILDPAPVPPGTIPEELLKVDVICPNESEAVRLTGVVDESIESMKTAAKILHERGAKYVAITLGHRGTLLYDGESSQIVDSIRITVVDTTGAGDAFAGALAVRWSECRDDVVSAIRWANIAGALAASRHGAQAGIATREEIEPHFQSKIQVKA